MRRARDAFGALRGLAERHRRWLVLAAIGAVVALGFYTLHNLTREIRYQDVRLALHAIPPGKMALALLLTASSYLALTFYDVLALRIVGRRLLWRTAAFASFTSYTLSHNLGLAWLTGGSARYRIYTVAGVPAADVARIILIASFTFWLGVLTLAGAALAFHSGPLLPATLRLSVELGHAVGGAALAAVAAFLAVAASGPRAVELLGWRLPLPGLRSALAQIAVAAIDLAAASAALFVLVPGAQAAALPAFVLAYALAMTLAVLSHVPGGVGVFEAVMIAALPGDRAALFAALIAYRIVYYLIPLAAGGALLALVEGRRRRLPGLPRLGEMQALAAAAAPVVVSGAAFAGGCILLISGTLPALSGRMHALLDFVPLPFVEASHVAASLAGTALLLMAPGLYRRLDGAFVATRALLVAGAAFSLLKGIDYEEAIVLLVIAGFLQWTRPAFYRRTALTAEPLSLQWLASVCTIAALALWLGLFAYRHVPYRNELWWEFTWRGDASRFLRASLAVAVLLGCAAFARLLGGSARPFVEPPPDRAAIDRALSSAVRADSMLAFTGDKRFLTAQSGDAFVMYQVKGSTWAVMGDPVGPVSAWPELFWRVRALAHAAQGRLLLYQISPATLPFAIELGLQIFKYGEEAVVGLPAFTIEGPRARPLRHAARRAAREGARFEIVPAARAAPLLPELRAVSDEWLAAKGHSEKRFSLGRFDEAYLCRFDLALVRCEGRIAAFANLWATANGEELSVDLMRHCESAPYGTMDFLFTRLMEWGRDQGYARFSLGLAPLSGIEARPLSPAWAKIAALLFRHGERFYGFRGLRAYKEKFAPGWEPRYVAGPGGLSTMRAMADLRALIGG